MLVGAHESIAGGVARAFERAEQRRSQGLQIFTKNARGWHSEPLDPANRSAFRAEARRTGLPAIAHGSYLVNLGSEDPVLRDKSLRCLADELTRCERLGIPFLVIHPGVHQHLSAGIRLIAEAINQVHLETPRFRSQICLEVTAGQGNSIGWRFEHLAEILSAVRLNDRVGICLDTCHLFAAGYNFKTRRGYDRVMSEFDDLVGLDRVRCFHFNDCKKPLGCRVDRHEEIGKGTLGLSPFRYLMNDARFACTLAVLETPFPERYGSALTLLQSLVRK